MALSFAQVLGSNVLEEPNGYTSDLFGEVSMNGNLDGLLLHTPRIEH